MSVCEFPVEPIYESYLSRTNLLRQPGLRSCACCRVLAPDKDPQLDPPRLLGSIKCDLILPDPEYQLKTHSEPAGLIVQPDLSVLAPS